VLKGAISNKGGAPLLRKGLVVFQFVLSMILISGTLVIYRQLAYMQEKDLGLNKEGLIMQYVEGKANSKYQTLKTTLLDHPAIQDISSSNENPLEIGNSTFSVSWEGKDPSREIIFHAIMADYNFIETMGIEMVAGRTPSPEFGTDTAAYVINEAAARVMGFEDPVGQIITVWGDEGPVVGVMGDFHIASLYQAIDPVVFKMSPEGEWILFVRPTPGKTREALAHMESVYSEMNPAFPFEYRFLDERYAEMYESEETLSSLANVFAMVAIFISCLGLLGLAAYTAERRTREIGIRKVLGASVSEIMVLLSRDFTLLVLLASIIALPLSLWAANQWLETFEFTASIPWWIYALAGFTGLGIAWLTVSYQALRAARANPIEALKDE
ncbi:MAG: FtsX-like permease family protein, partial [Bacteroidota bacterium]